jgi:hypothetical protein
MSEPRLEFDQKKVSEAHAKLIEVFREAKLGVGEILTVYGNLGVALGNSIKGYGQNMPQIGEIEIEYARSPDPGLALILQGAEVVSWYGDWERIMLEKQGTKEE